MVNQTGMHVQRIPARAILHENYINNRNAITNDIAVLELAYPVNIDNFTRSVCLGTEETLQSVKSRENPECYVTGFGRTEEYFSGMLFFCVWECNSIVRLQSNIFHQAATCYPILLFRGCKPNAYHSNLGKIDITKNRGLFFKVSLTNYSVVLMVSIKSITRIQKFPKTLISWAKPYRCM